VKNTKTKTAAVTLSAAQRSSATTAKKRAAEAAGGQPVPGIIGNSFVQPIVTAAEARAARIEAAKTAPAVVKSGPPVSADAVHFVPVRRVLTDEDRNNARPESLPRAAKTHSTHSASELASAIAANNKRAVDAMKAAGVTPPTAGKPSTITAAQAAKVSAALRPSADRAVCSKCGRDNNRPAKTADCRNAGACAARVAALKAAVQPASAAVPAAAAVKPVAAVRKPAAAKTAKRK